MLTRRAHNEQKNYEKIKENTGNKFLVDEMLEKNFFVHKIIKNKTWVDGASGWVVLRNHVTKKIFQRGFFRKKIQTF